MKGGAGAEDKANVEVEHTETLSGDAEGAGDNLSDDEFDDEDYEDEDDDDEDGSGSNGSQGSRKDFLKSKDRASSAGGTRQQTYNNQESLQYS